MRILVAGSFQHVLRDLTMELCASVLQAAHELLRRGSLRHFLLMIDYVFTKIPDVAELVEETSHVHDGLHDYENLPAESRDWIMACGMSGYSHISVASPLPSKFHQLSGFS